MEIEYTNRGFKIAKWRDRYDNECSIQESSLASEACIWLGTSVDRMHLTQQMVYELLPMLHLFALHGSLGGAET